jgi:hypothetical protein
MAAPHLPLEATGEFQSEAEALQRLIQLYDETNRSDEAAKYRAELAEWFSGQLQRDNAWPLLWGWPRF